MLVSPKKYSIYKRDRGLVKQKKGLAPFFSGPLRVVGGIGASKNDCYLGWGRKRSGHRAVELASKAQASYALLEDGFLRSIDLGVNGAAALSLVVDQEGIYYDATVGSQLERLIEQVDINDLTVHDDAVAAMAYIVQHNLSKYNNAPVIELPPLPSGLTSRVLVVDQTYGDMSVVLGGGVAGVAGMLDAALTENPDAQVLVKIHPDVLAGKKQGYMTYVEENDNPRVLFWAEPCSPVALLKQVDQVYVYTSQMGFEALLLDKPVQCFGLPWYAGWGLTQDRHPAHADLLGRRTPGKALWQLFAAAYLQYVRYRHPDFNQGGDIFDVMPWLVRNRDASQQLAGHVYCVGMSNWKKATLKPFFKVPGVRLHFVNSLKKLEQRELPADAKLLIWGSRSVAASKQFAQSKGIPLWRMEDGFVRSVGLGSDLFRPLSLVLDRTGMYYDPASRSDLEQLLQTHEWTGQQEAQAQEYIQAFTQQGLSKYNLGGRALNVQAAGKTVVLVPGQVEDDASVQYGSPVIRTNAALIRAVRQCCPDAYILYKPHPDVVAGNRQGHVPEDLLEEYVDQVVAEANIVDCIRAADEVHTMTSLTGFEALLHGKVVHCYGGPFYAGWGLTTDYLELPHRNRRLAVQQLVFATIFQYPSYIMPPGVGVPGFASPESVMQWLALQRQKQQVAGKQGWLSKKCRKLTALWQLFFQS